jgi:hypothetical protein
MMVIHAFTAINPHKHNLVTLATSTYANHVASSIQVLLCFFICLSYGDDICGVSALYLPSCTNVGITNGAILPLIIF